MSLFPLSVFKRKKDDQIPLAMVALSDAPSAQIACDAGIDAILVGDSLGNTALGFDSTLPVTMDMMAHHVAAVVRGVKSSTRPDVPIIADLPFGSYATIEKAVENATRLMQLGAHAVKMEGLGVEYAERSVFAALKATGIPVMGHIGFTPQSQMALGAVVQGKTHRDAQILVNAARSLEMEGCFAMVLEAMTEEAARKITEARKVPTIGIGAGNGCDGQVLVWHDLVGISAKSLKMARAYAQTRQIWTEALQEYKRDVESKAFPTEQNSWSMSPEELEKWREEGAASYRGQEYMDSEVEIESPEGEPFHAFEKVVGVWERADLPFDDDRDPFANQ
ncbi:3-methyl-2-oxobutanoate hydroxymethyltransferase [Abditibacteriota bacterium]|nr:3-methyl-2-oxobutanoate hydroxymethyltransferase [Abditibacteriota bacterium]